MPFHIVKKDAFPLEGRYLAGQGVVLVVGRKNGDIAVFSQFKISSCDPPPLVGRDALGVAVDGLLLIVVEVEVVKPCYSRWPPSLF